MTASGVHSLVFSHGTHGTYAHSSVLVRAELLHVIDDVLYVDLLIAISCLSGYVAVSI